MKNAIFPLLLAFLLAGTSETVSDMEPSPIRFTLVETSIGSPTNISIGTAADRQPIKNCRFVKSYQDSSKSPLVLNFNSTTARIGLAPQADYTYLGSGLEHGDCGITIANTTPDHFGEWRISLVLKNNLESKTIFVRVVHAQMTTTIHDNASVTKSSNTTESSSFLLPAVTAVLVVIALVMLAILIIKIRNRHTFVSREELRNFMNGNAAAVEIAYRAPYDKSRYEIKKGDFTLSKAVCLGYGKSGWVRLGKATIGSEERKVAIKVANQQNDDNISISDCLSEIKVLAYLGKHPHITELLGANTSELNQGKIFVFLELCSLGCLDKYLRELRPAQFHLHFESAQQSAPMSRNPEAASQKAVLPQQVSEDLFRWAGEICEGMEFLATKHIVHADLAARNVLLNEQKEAKICDFGLSRRTNNFAGYVKQQQEPLPWKWMAPEAMRLQEFSEKTDVWAFGVTLWEMYTFGDCPFPGLSWDANFSQMLQRGFMLGEPQYNENDMYSVMKACWDLNPATRPTFTDLRSKYLKQGTKQ